MFSDVDTLHRASTALVNRRAEQSVTNEHAERRIVQLEREIRRAFFDNRYVAADVATKHRELEQLIRDSHRAEADAAVLSSRLDACAAIKNSVEAECSEMREAAESRVAALSCFPSEAAQVIRAARERRDAISAMQECKGLYEELWKATLAIRSRDTAQELCARLKASLDFATTSTQKTKAAVAAATSLLQEKIRVRHELNAQLHWMEEELTRGRERGSSLQAEHAAAVDSLRSGTAMHAALKEETARRKATVAELTRQLTELQLRSAKARSLTEERRAVLNQELSKAQDAQVRMADDVARANANIEAQRAQIEGSEAELAQLRATLDEKQRTAAKVARWAADLSALASSPHRELRAQVDAARAKETQLLQRVGDLSLRLQALNDFSSTLKDLETEETLSRAVSCGDEVEERGWLMSLEAASRETWIPLQEKETSKRADLEATSQLVFHGLQSSFRLQLQAIESATKPRVTRAKRTPHSELDQPPRPQPPAANSDVRPRRTLAVKRRDSVSSQESSSGWIFAEAVVSSHGPTTIGTTPLSHRSTLVAPSTSSTARRALFADIDSPDPRKPVVPTPAKTRQTTKFTLGGSTGKKSGPSRVSALAKTDVFNVFDL